MVRGQERARSAKLVGYFFFPNEREGEAMTGEKDPWRMLKAMQNCGVCAVAMKLGRNGAAANVGRRHCFQEASAIEPVDTTGAGDCSMQGFCMLAAGWNPSMSAHGYRLRRNVHAGAGRYCRLPRQGRIGNDLCNVK